MNVSPYVAEAAKRAAAIPAAPAVDFDFTDHGSLTTVRPLNKAARQHLKANTDGQWLNGALCVEARYAPELSAALCRDGFVVELPNGRRVTAEDLA